MWMKRRNLLFVFLFLLSNPAAAAFIDLHQQNSIDEAHESEDFTNLLRIPSPLWILCYPCRGVSWVVTKVTNVLFGSRALKQTEISACSALLRNPVGYHFSSSIICPAIVEVAEVAAAQQPFCSRIFLCPKKKQQQPPPPANGGAGFSSKNVHENTIFQILENGGIEKLSPELENFREYLISLVPTEYLNITLGEHTDVHQVVQNFVAAIDFHIKHNPEKN